MNIEDALNDATDNGGRPYIMLEGPVPTNRSHYRLYRDKKGPFIRRPKWMAGDKRARIVHANIVHSWISKDTGERHAIYEFAID